MSERTCLITGTTHGIGLVTARELADAGYQVVMACRNAARAELVRDHLLKVTGNEAVHVVPLDLASLSSVAACAATVRERFPRLALLVNNAGMMTGDPALSKDGYELTFACNHLGPFALTTALLDHLEDGARIVNVASKVHFRGELDLDTLRPGKKFSGLAAYARSKLANVMFTLDLAERLAHRSIHANCLHPGVVATNIAANGNAVVRLGMRLAGRFLFDAERGAQTSLYLALHPDAARLNGCYLDEHQAVQPPAPAALDVEARAALWQRSEDIVAGAQAPS